MYNVGSAVMEAHLKTETWTVSSLEAGPSAFLDTATSLEPDGEKRVAHYLLKEGREGGRRVGRAVQESSVGKTPVDRSTKDTEHWLDGRAWLRSFQAEKIF